MSYETLAAEASRRGIEVGYHHGYSGEWVQAPAQTLQALIELVGERPDEPPPPTGRCFLPRMPRWGWAVQPYAIRSRLSWGIGDLTDLQRLIAWTSSRDGVVLTTPLNAGAPGVPSAESPYFPSSRIWLDPIWIDVTKVGEMDGPARAKVSNAAAELNSGKLIDRDAVSRVKLKALEALHASRRWPEAERFAAERPDLEGWARFCAIAEEHGPCWRRWPQQLRSPGSTAVRSFARGHADRVRFHSWLQWVAHDQLAASASGLIADLPVGVDPCGADTWWFKEQFLEGATVGAPPDEFAPSGQSWGLAALHPHRVVASGGEAFLKTVDGVMGQATGIRIDHVMGLFRLFMIPEGMDPTQGAYVRYPSHHLLAWLSSASQRNSCFVIGEDLGTVEPPVREAMEGMDMLGFRVLLFDPDPAVYPKLTVAVATTHDLPTIAGLLSGEDLAASSRMGVPVDERAYAAMRERVIAVAGSDDVPGAVTGAYSALAASPSAIVLAALQDALESTERPNMPGTTAGWPNWRIPLPIALEEVLAHPRVGELAGILSSR